MNFSDELIDRIKQKKSLICLGLDPDPTHEYFPSHLQAKLNDVTNIIREFTKSLIDELAEDIVMIKPNLKFYEALGMEGFLKELTRHAQKKDLLVIIDSKGNDILTSMEKHYEAMFKVYNADAITVNAYMGSDVIQPFHKYGKEAKGIFILVKTSNPSSNEFQDLFSINVEIDKFTHEISTDRIIGKTLKRNYIHMAELIKKWGTEYIGDQGYSSIGAVVGATYPQEMNKIREILPHHFFLIPGYGAQGGSINTISSSINADGLGAIINSSRGIMYAWNKQGLKGTDYLKAASKEVGMMKKDLAQFLK
ncbi:MAG: orotidine-5'-phosphate decarboxylase [Candidatus Helarchaeota archaeon]